jgi:hypothetical protein
VHLLCGLNTSCVILVLFNGRSRGFLKYSGSASGTLPFSSKFLPNQHSFMILLRDLTFFSHNCALEEPTAVSSVTGTVRGSTYMLAQDYVICSARSGANFATSAKLGARPTTGRNCSVTLYTVDGLNVIRVIRWLHVPLRGRAHNCVKMPGPPQGLANPASGHRRRM